jgi:hypothetical protein
MRDVCSLISTLRHQLNVLRRKSPQRPTFSSIDRLVFAGLYRLAPGVLDALKIVKPETVIRWHRAGFRIWARGRRYRETDIVRPLPFRWKSPRIPTNLDGLYEYRYGDHRIE